MKIFRYFRYPTKIFLLFLLFSNGAIAQSGLPIINMVDDGGGNTEYSLTLQLLALMTALTLLPSAVLMMTSFVRIIIVMSLLRQALGTAQTPPNQVLIGLSLFLTIFIMSPILSSVYDQAVKPYSDGAISFDIAVSMFFCFASSD